MTAPRTSRLSDAAWNPQTTGSAGTQQGPAPLVSHDPAHLPGRMSTAGDTSGAGRCDYAWCDKPRVWKADGWSFCGIHFLEHCSLFRGAKWPHKRDLHDPWSKEMDMKPHGTPAALVRHRRAGEMPCIACRNAAEQRKVDAGQRSANSNWGEERKGTWTA